MSDILMADLVQPCSLGRARVRTAGFDTASAET